MLRLLHSKYPDKFHKLLKSMSIAFCLSGFVGNLKHEIEINATRNFAFLKGDAIEWILF